VALVVLEVERFRGVSFVEMAIEEGINLLYGPNSGGKSTVLYALLSLMGVSGGPLARKLELGGRSRVSVSSGSGYVKYSGGGLSCAAEGATSSGASVGDVLLCVRRFWEGVGVRRVGYVAGDTVAVYEVAGGKDIKFELPLWNRSSWELLTQSPQMLSSDAVEEIRDLTGIESLQAGYALKQGRRVPVELLSYSERKVVALVLAASHSDMVVVEGYEAGLHPSQALRLLARLNGTAKAVIAETHMGVLMAEGMERGWNVYYVEDGKALKLTHENMLNAEILKREVERYVRARPL